MSLSSDQREGYVPGRFLSMSFDKREGYVPRRFLSLIIDQRKGYIPGRFPRLSEVEAVVHYNLPHPPVVSIRHPIIVYNIYILLGGDIMYIKNEIFIKQALIHKSFDFQIVSTGLFKFLYKIELILNFYGKNRWK